MLSNKEVQIGSSMARIFAFAVIPNFLIQAFALDPANPGYDATWGPVISVLNVVTGFALLFVFALTTKLFGDDNNPYVELQDLLHLLRNVSLCKMLLQDH